TMLTGVLLVMAAVISICVINYYKNETPATEVETSTPRNKKNEPLIAVNVEKPEQKSETQSKTKTVTPSVKTEPASKMNTPSVKTETSAKPAKTTPAANTTAAVTQRPTSKTV
ncbi:hypothetical protein, partial [Treponema sp. R6D11]